MVAWSNYDITDWIITQSFCFPSKALWMSRNTSFTLNWIPSQVLISSIALCGMRGVKTSRVIRGVVQKRLRNCSSSCRNSITNRFLPEFCRFAVSRTNQWLLLSLLH